MDYRKPFSKLGEESKGLHLLYTIWTKPTATLRFVLANFPDKYVTVLLALGGTARAVDRAARQHDGDFLTMNQVSPIALLIGALSGWLTYYVYGWALSATGKWLGGNAQPEEARTVLAWALVPLISGLGLIVLYVAFFNNELFTIAPASDLHKSVGIGLLIMQGVSSVWTLVILSKGVQMIQGFSTGRTLVNILLPGAILIGVIILVGELYQLL